MRRVDASQTDEDLAEIVKASRPGDVLAFETLMTRHKGRVLANCRHMSGSAEEAEDLAQEVFVKAYFGLRRFEGRAKFGSWLQRIKINHCLNHIRKHKGRVNLDVDDPAMETVDELRETHTPEDATLRVERRERIRVILDDLPDTLRIPLVMCDVDGFAYQEIADTLGIGLSATKMRIKRGREEFRRRLDLADARDVARPAGDERSPEPPVAS